MIRHEIPEMTMRYEAAPVGIRWEVLNRMGFIEHAAGRPKIITADRVNMAHEAMDEHYDKATKNKQMERHQDYLIDV